MPKADFFVLPVADPAARHNFLCRLAEQIVPQGHQLFVLCESESEARELDSLLWGFKPESFIPHQLVDGDPAAPVILGWKPDQAPTDAVFVNLTLSLPLPAEVMSAQRVVEIVVQDERILTATRKHYKQLKDAGFEAKMTDMRKKHA